jgi:hypothetical protein
MPSFRDFPLPEIWRVKNLLLSVAGVSSSDGIAPGLDRMLGSLTQDCMNFTIT